MVALRGMLIAGLCACACGRATLGDDSGGDEGDDAFARQCRSGCIDIEDCAPDEFAALFADVDECASSCEARYGECTDDAQSYFACVSAASCPTVAEILTSGPYGTECGPAFAAAEHACGR